VYFVAAGAIRIGSAVWLIFLVFWFSLFFFLDEALSGGREFVGDTMSTFHWTFCRTYSTHAFGVDRPRLAKSRYVVSSVVLVDTTVPDHEVVFTLILPTILSNLSFW